MTLLWFRSKTPARLRLAGLNADVIADDGLNKSRGIKNLLSIFKINAPGLGRPGVSLSHTLSGEHSAGCTFPRLRNPAPSLVRKDDITLDLKGKEKSAVKALSSSGLCTFSVCCSVVSDESPTTSSNLNGTLKYKKNQGQLRGNVENDLILSVFAIFTTPSFD